MTALLSSFLSFILLYKYWAIFVLVLAGSFIVPLPGNAILIALGAFSSQKYMSLSLVIILCVVTNILTDFFAFFLTYRYGDTILNFFKIRRDGKLSKVERYLRNYAFGTIFITRIGGPFAPTVNFVAGLIGVPFRKFALYDISGNIIGSSIFILIGYFLGNYWQSVLNDTWIWGAGIFVIFLIYIIYKTIMKRKLLKKLTLL